MARVVMRLGGAGAVPGLVGSMNDVLPLAVLNSEAVLVRARCPSSVVNDDMVMAFASMTSWKILIDVYVGFDEDVLMRGMSSMRVSNCAVMASNPVCVDMMVWG